MKLFKLNLHMFEGEGGESSGESTQLQSGEAVQSAAIEHDTDAQNEANENRKKAFEDLINGEYKDLYTKKTQDMINKRFKETKNLQAKLDKQQLVIDMLQDKYKVDSFDEIQAKIEEDNDFWYELAEENGMTIEQYKQYQKIKRENESLKKQAEEQRKSEETKKITSRWMQEAEELKAKFPNFDMQTEVQNPAFLRLLQSGTPVEHAYKVIHYDEILASEKANTEDAIYKNIRANGMRPTENGTASQSAFTIKKDVSKLSKEDRKDIAKRVARGEVITFR